jgi:hypothetical protein
MQNGKHAPTDVAKPAPNVSPNANPTFPLSTLLVIVIVSFILRR